MMAWKRERERESGEKLNLSGVELDSKTTRISESLGAAALVDHSRETNNDRSLDTRSSEKISTGKVGNVMGDFKETFSTSTSGMNNSFRNPLPVKVG